MTMVWSDWWKLWPRYWQYWDMSTKTPYGFNNYEEKKHTVAFGPFQYSWWTLT